MISRPLGKGAIAYLGTLPDARSMKRVLVGAAFDAGSPYVYSPQPPQVEICTRSNTKKTITIAINHGDAPAEIQLWGRMNSLLPDSVAKPIYLPTGMPSTQISLPPQGVAFLVPAEQQGSDQP